MKRLILLLAPFLLAAPAQASTELEAAIRLFCVRAATINVAGHSTAPGSYVAAFAQGRMGSSSRYTYTELWYFAKALGIDPCQKLW